MTRLLSVRCWSSRIAKPEDVSSVFSRILIARGSSKWWNARLKSRKIGREEAVSERGVGETRERRERGADEASIDEGT